jgi:ABC-type multidrug transport system fused ATPase/permease subunit
MNVLEKALKSKLPKQDIDLIKRYYAILRPHLHLAVVSVVMMGVISLISLGLPYLSKIVFDDGIMEKNMNYLFLAAGVGFGAMLLRFFAGLGQSRSMYTYSSNTDVAVKETFFRKLMYLPFADIDRFKSPYLMHRVESTIRGVSSLQPTSVGKSLINVFNLVAVTVILFKLNMLLFLSAILISSVYFLSSYRLD